MTITERIARSKREILADIRDGVLPSDVASFSDLNEHVDANEYGGLCEDDAMVGDYIGLGNAVQHEVDRWLKAGRA